MRRLGVLVLLCASACGNHEQATPSPTAGSAAVAAGSAVVAAGSAAVAAGSAAVAAGSAAVAAGSAAGSVEPPADPGDPTKLAADLRALGELQLAAYPLMANSEDEIPALGACVRPTADEKTALLDAVKAKTNAEVTVRYGCKDADGILLDAAFEANPDPHTGGVWRVLRANPAGAGAKLTTVVELKGPARSAWSEWMDEVTLVTLALGDLDGDGKRDLILGEVHHEGGAMTAATTVSVWSSRTKRRAIVGTYSDHVSIDPQPSSTPTYPVVFAVSKDRGGLPVRHCIESTMQDSQCSAISGSARLVAVQAIATKFIAPGKYGPNGTPTPDRELLADYLATLMTMEDEKTSLLAEAVPSTAAERIARRVDRFAQAPVGVDQTPDYLSSFADAPCPAVKPADVKAAQGKVKSWIGAHDATAKGARKLDRVLVWTVCAKGTASYVLATWMYLATDKTATSRAGLFSFVGKTATLLADVSVDGTFDCDGPACAGPPQVELPVRLYRHGESVIALAIGAGSTADQQAVTVYVDGVPTKGPDQGKGLSFLGSNVVADGATPPQLWHWDGSAWTAVDKPAWIAAKDARAEAYVTVGDFDLKKWSADPGYQKTIEGALAVLEQPAE